MSLIQVYDLRSAYAARSSFSIHSPTPDTFTPDGRKTWLLGDRAGVSSTYLNFLMASG